MQFIPLLLHVYELCVITLLQGNAECFFLNISNEKYYSSVKILYCQFVYIVKIVYRVL